MTKIIMTNHAKVDRIDRLTEIAMTVGWGDIILTIQENHKRYCLTSTGVLLVKNEVEEILITAYLANHFRVAAMYKTMGYDRVPTAIYKKVLNNEKRYKKSLFQKIFFKKLLTNASTCDII